MTTNKADLGEQLTLAAQRNATDAVMMHQAVADRLGLHVTDLRCLNLLRLGGPATPGDLAVRTGLTTGAVTRMIDRLLKAGFVTREHDAQDRRRVIVTAAEDRIAEIAPHYELLAQEFGKIMGDYSTEQLELLLELFDRLHETSLLVTTRLRERE
ncbi:MarR family winged helix-turn-helix transcriptional regulator [Nocardia mexicana]|uniref:DNA-binding MarR family transcriptional regulator n=1 Tax=Nocardia mexicana TaxID=279262 RepID=A0A370GJT9_9NOCA|nr:MarR family transcriptional regulator [Nocardia mexicana]RDI43931.1 DNA-binding MarR family transcriptional regulator [Nocardia mexicana]